MSISKAISQLLDYATECGLIEDVDRVWAANGILEALSLEEWDAGAAPSGGSLEETLKVLLDNAAARGVIEDTITQRDLLDTKVMGALTPRPSNVISTFWEMYRSNPRNATDWFYRFNQDDDYIRRYRIAKDLKWKAPTEYGDLDITINLSKPEKDPKEIAAAKCAVQSGYPKCLLCKENEGYAGRINHPARQNLRMIPLELNGEEWFFQYSPYVYYNEHCIVLRGRHVPMKIDVDTFRRLLGFVSEFPDYFLGSNADLPIVGGSILSHDHFQGGRYDFAMTKAPIEEEVCFAGFNDVHAGIVKWPMSVIRLQCSDANRLIELADKVLCSWRSYTDESAFIYAETNGESHNTITPIARMREGQLELDLVLRNNITTDEHPLGVFHPHDDLHHIKKENIGLIEVMGLAVLPARLKTELSQLADVLAGSGDINEVKRSEALSKHAKWATELSVKHEFTKENAMDILKEEVGLVFMKVLEDAGVFKRTPEGKAAFLRFAESV